jgi:hypothetical protein
VRFTGEHPAEINATAVISASTAPLITCFIIPLCQFYYFAAQQIHLPQQGTLLLQYLLLVGLQSGILLPELHILRKDLPVLLRQHIDGSLQLREHIVIMLPAPDKPCEHATDKSAREGEHQKV